MDAAGRSGTALSPGLAGRLGLAADLLVLAPALALATRLSGQPWPGLSDGFTWLAAAAVCAWALLARALRCYANDVPRGLLDHLALGTVQVLAVVTLLAVARPFAPASVAFPAAARVLAVLWPLTVFLRLFVFRALSAREAPIEEVLILGAGPDGRVMGEGLLARGQRRLLGYLAFSDERQSPTLPAPFLGSARDLESLLRVTPLSEVFLAGNAQRDGEELQAAVRVCEKLGLPFALPPHDLRLERARPVAPRGPGDGFLHYRIDEAGPGRLALKRLFDIVSSAAALWVLAPLLALATFVIKLGSRGAVFHHHVRMGVQGRPFHLLGFRLPGDPSGTRLGRFLHRCPLHELPQLLNVLRGDLSVVGPRPPVPSEVAQLEPWQRRRLSVRPGLTWIWRLSGRTQLSLEDWLRLPQPAPGRWSLAGDLRLLFGTGPGPQAEAGERPRG